MRSNGMAPETPQDSANSRAPVELALEIGECQLTRTIASLLAAFCAVDRTAPSLAVAVVGSSPPVGYAPAERP